MTRPDNKTVRGLQSLHALACDALIRVEARDLHWARAMIATVNAGNSLLRTEMQQAPKRKRRGP